MPTEWAWALRDCWNHPPCCRVMWWQFHNVCTFPWPVTTSAGPLGHDPPCATPTVARIDLVMILSHSVYQNLHPEHSWIASRNSPPDVHAHRKSAEGRDPSKYHLESCKYPRMKM
eukprot:scaffold115857_cov63-Attheya_sp.AAC.1